MSRCRWLVASALSLSPSPLLPAQTWFEIGDAGETAATAQQTMGSGNLTQIQGDLATANDADVYLIQVFDTTTFSASTIGGAPFDTQLFLFDEQGQAVTHNDDAPTGGDLERAFGDRH